MTRGDLERRWDLERERDLELIGKYSKLLRSLLKTFDSYSFLKAFTDLLRRRVLGDLERILKGYSVSEIFVIRFFFTSFLTMILTGDDVSVTWIGVSSHLSCHHNDCGL